ncbi:MAG: diaminohydroxyphosphoribosylaminopyrimidine deaminase [Actinomycetota bacterium]|jgi:diaminohydroxyphosphoribosylaminopyrimidine deaminase/5-amino-6-(5-phosphoribosylamino)uracil reductase
MTDHDYMMKAIEAASLVRLRTSPNPWVGCVIVTANGQVFVGATEAPGGRHAEVVALDAVRAALSDTQGATVFTTLEPCSHHGRTGPCTEALISAGVSRVVSAITDPDQLVGGQGFAALRSAGITVEVGLCADLVAEQLRPYIHHRITGRPFVILKLASTLDGRTAAVDGSSQWITGEAARTAAHQLRAESDAIVVGSGTVRRDNPTLTTRLVDGPSPRRVVLGKAPEQANVHPCLEWDKSLCELLDSLGNEGVLQLMVEGGATVASSFHQQNLVDRYVLYVAPAFMGGNDGAPLFNGGSAPSMQQLWRGTLRNVRQLGSDIEVTIDNPRINEEK